MESHADAGYLFTCDGCGVCCEEMGMPPNYAVAYLLDIPEELRQEIAYHQKEERRTGRTRHERGLPCIWYDWHARRCRHHPYRPDACRNVPVGSESCLFWRVRRNWRLGTMYPHPLDSHGTDSHGRTDMPVTPDRIQRLFDRLSREATAGGYHLNPDGAFVEDLLDGLITNEDRYSYPACPCRLATGDRTDDLDIVCPCDYRDDDIAQYGACYCALYVSPDIAGGRAHASSIPDRRPVNPEDRRQNSSSGGSVPAIEKLPYPVWRCRVCGYLCARENPPELCPVCKAKKDRFERFM
jgi:ferredoxin-thioredoxin reductase catalytic chain